MGGEQGAPGAKTLRWSRVRHLRGVWKAQGLLMCRQSAGRLGPAALGASGSSILMRCREIIVISLPRLNQHVIKSGSVLPWDFFFFLVGTES